ncbi:unnamed protein product [Caretta caretta]
MPAATLGQAVLAPQPWGLGTAPHSPGQDAAAIMHWGSECHKGQLPPSAAPGHGASTDCQVRAPLLSPHLLPAAQRPLALHRGQPCQVRAPLLSPHLLPAAQRPLALHRGQPCQVRAPPAEPCRPGVGGIIPSAVPHASPAKPPPHQPLSVRPHPTAQHVQG